MTKQAGPLNGLKVLDLSRVLSGPYCSMMLADLGAEVIKIEEPEVGDTTRLHAPFVDDMSHYYLAINRNKYSVSLNVQNRAGAEVIRALASKCDIVLENFRPGVLERLGIGYEVLHEVNPRLIFCSITGYGRDGDMATAPAFDAVIQGLSGVMAINGMPDGPPLRLGIPMADLATGMWAAVGILAGVAQRERTGEGLRIDLSMIDSLVVLLGYIAEIYLVSGESPPRVGNQHHHVAPYGSYEVEDGQLVITPVGDHFWRRWCAACDRPDLVEDPRFETVVKRRVHSELLRRTAEEIMKTRTKAEWEARFKEADVPFGEIVSVGEAIEAARIRGLVSMTETTRGTKVGVMKSPLLIDGERRPTNLRNAPGLGVDTVDILSELLGFDSEDIARLQSEGAFSRPPTHDDKRTESE